jgi:MoaA/NifB/PqqE/SkfB family radical SAM enzyme
MDPKDYRFEIALSFAGDNKRDKVRKVAELLRERVGQGRVFFDEWFESELAGPDAHIVLQNYYGKMTRLVVTCVCQRYNEKPWTQEEWRAIQAFERDLRDANTDNVKRMRFLPLRFGDGEIDALFSTAIVPDVRTRPPTDIAELILQRLYNANQQSAKPIDFHPQDRGKGMKNDPISIAYALSWKCYCNCLICHSGLSGKDYMITNINTWKTNLESICNYNGSARVTLTGGEPMFFWDSNEELLDLIKYLHEKKVHVCLNTTGINLTPGKLQELDKYTDTILLSIRGLTRIEMQTEFGINEDAAQKLLDTQMMILNEIKKTNIRLEISTVVTKENFSRIEDLGWKLMSINSNIIWRVEEYYKNGKQNYEEEDRFDLQAAKYDSLMIKLYQLFSNKMKFISHSSKESRLKAPDVFMFPNGVLHKTSDHRYSKVKNIKDYDLKTMKTRRNWLTYLKSLRNWEWERDDYGSQYREDFNSIK